MTSPEVSDRSRSSTNATPFVSIAVAVVIGAALAWAGSTGAKSAAGLGIHWWIVAAAFGINWVAFVPSYLKRTEHYFDLIGSLTYLSTTVLALVLANPAGARGWLLTVLITVWAGRLGTFLFQRVKAVGKDGRFDRIKQNAPQFAMTWTLQGLWVTFTAAAAHAAIATADPKSLGVWAWVGLAVWLLGFGIEVIADRQKSAFRADPVNSGSFIQDGLWAWSRHPNYFGEIVLWVGVAIIAFPVLSGWQYVTLLSPVFVTVLLTRISGVPALERRADKRWGGQDDYEAYKTNTPVLIPRPPAA